MLEAHFAEGPSRTAAAPDRAIRPLGPAARFSFRLPEGSAAGIGPVAGFALDLPILRSASRPGRLAARLGPDEWLLIGPEDEAEAIRGEVEAALSGRFFSLVEIGHRHEAFEVAGPRAADILNAGCPLDLAESAFPAGAAARTLMGKAEIVLIRTGADIYRVECWRSFADYVGAFLREAAL